MNDNFDDLIFDDEDEFLETEDSQITTEPPVEPAEQPVEDEDLTSEVLRLKGISDPDKIKFEDETGAIIERSWDTLSREEQLNILTSQEEQQELNLADDEIELLNAIRNSGMSVNDYLNAMQVPQEPSTPSYKIDELSDEDKLVVARARRAQRFLSQPFHVAEQFTGLPGVMVPLSETIRGFKMILSGEMDEYPEQAFLNVGTIDEAIAKGRKLLDEVK